MNFEEFLQTRIGREFLQQKPAATVKDIADKYPDPPKEKIVETTCPCCQKRLRLKIKV